MSNTFVTGVDVGGTAATSPPRASSPSASGSPQHSTVRRLEDEEFHFTPGDISESLPPTVNYRMLTEDVLDTVIDPEDAQSQRVWSTHVPSPDYNAIVRDLFWYCFLHVFRKATGRSAL